MEILPLNLSPPPQVNVCYFCQDLVNSPSSLLEASPGYCDDLFLLHPDEKPLTAEPLLLFCIDVSGSMSITFQVRAHQVMEASVTSTNMNGFLSTFFPQGHRERWCGPQISAPCKFLFCLLYNLLSC